MRFRLHHFVFLAPLAAWLGPIGTVSAVFPPTIKDDAKFLSPETLEKANKKIRDIYREFHKDVVVETFPAIPADSTKKYQDDGKEKFFTEWADRRVEDLGVNGIYIQIVKQPGHLWIATDKKTRNKAFTAGDEKKLIEKLLAAFKEKKFDEGMVNALDLVQSTLKSNRAK